MSKRSRELEDEALSHLLDGEREQAPGRRQRRLSYQPRATPWVHGREVIKALKARFIILWGALVFTSIPFVGADDGIGEALDG